MVKNDAVTHLLLSRNERTTEMRAPIEVSVKRNDEETVEESSILQKDFGPQFAYKGYTITFWFSPRMFVSVNI